MTIQQHASFDSSAAELNATSKLVRAWESIQYIKLCIKNIK